MRVRLDQLVVQRGLAETRERAQSLIMAGAVLVDGQAAHRPGQAVQPSATIALEASGPDYVSRGALKLAGALDAWHIDPTGWVTLDVGASTGGFTDLLLRRGAARVYAVDVGHGQLHYKLRSDPRVVSMERTNARYLVRLPEAPDLVVADVSFISLRLVLPAIFALIQPPACIVALIKPQFEAGRQHVRRGGVVRDAAVHCRVLMGLVDWSAERRWRITDLMPSPITGPAGNVEFLSKWTPDAEPAPLDRIQQAVSAAAIISARC